MRIISNNNFNHNLFNSILAFIRYFERQKKIPKDNFFHCKILHILIISDTMNFPAEKKWNFYSDSFTTVQHEIAETKIDVRYIIRLCAWKIPLRFTHYRRTLLLIVCRGFCAQKMNWRNDQEEIGNKKYI